MRKTELNLPTFKNLVSFMNLNLFVEKLKTLKTASSREILSNKPFQRLRMLYFPKLPLKDFLNRRFGKFVDNEICMKTVEKIKQEENTYKLFQGLIKLEL